jgi:hypothetical protein
MYSVFDLMQILDRDLGCHFYEELIQAPVNKVLVPWKIKTMVIFRPILRLVPLNYKPYH